LLMKTKLINLKQQLAGLTLATWAASKRFGHPWRMSHFNSSQLLCYIYKYIDWYIVYCTHTHHIHFHTLANSYIHTECVLVTPTLWLWLWLWLSCHAYVIIPWLAKAKAIRKANVGQMFATCKQALSAEIHLLAAAAAGLILKTQPILKNP